MARIIVVDAERCLGCKSCVLACAVAHSGVETLAEAVRLAQPPQPRLHVEPVAGAAMPVQCHHCEDAPCMSVCPSGAIHRPSPDGPVLIDPARCIGCKFCVFVCPFGVIELSRSGGAVLKCDQCIERTGAGREPACVEACPTGALRFVELDEELRLRRRQAARRLMSERAGGGANEP